MNERHDQSVADENVERLLENAYAPELPDPDFVNRVGDRVLQSCQATQVETERSRDDASPIWQLIPWAVAGLALIVSFFASPSTPDPGTQVFHEGEVIWIDGKAYLPAELANTGSDQRNSEKGEVLRPVNVAKEKKSPIRTVSLVGKHGLTARPAIAHQPSTAEIGKTLSTLAGQRKRVSLPDGSTLFVDENSSVDINEDRTIQLAKGRVFLEVAKHATSKFVVKTPNRDITALGTKFAVQVASGKTSVVVTQGKVQFSGSDKTVGAGQRAETKGNSDQPVATAAPRASHELSWTKELMAASKSPLVPGSKFDGGALVTVDPNGLEARLSLRKYHIDVHIEDGFARTTIDQTYFNHLTSRLEGTFYFPLPPDASISRLAMYVNGKLMEGGMCERERARDVFETIKHRALDPALLEWIDGSTFKMRVFPLEGRQEKRIVLSYTQRLADHYGISQYRFPAGHNMENVGNWSARINLATDEFDWKCPSHEMKSVVKDKSVQLSTAAKNTKPNKDIVVNLVSKKKDSPQLSTFDHEGAKYVMVRHRPLLVSKDKDADENRADRSPKKWIFLFDADGSRNPLLARVQVDIVKTLLENAEHDDKFAIVTAGTRMHAFATELKAAAPENVASAVEFLNRTHLIGALDLAKALKTCETFANAAKDSTLVHVGSGVPILGERQTNILLKKLPADVEYVGVGVGKRWNRSFMKAAANKTGGYFTQINPDEKVTWRAFELSSILNMPRLLDLRVEADGCEFYSFADSSIHGEQICAIAKLDADGMLPKTIRICGKMDGDFSETIEVKVVNKEAGYLPRQWAKLAIDKMVADNAAKHKGQIIELSKAMYVMSPFTSLLVLENDEMYEQYKVDRGRKDHWALYPCPEKIKVIHEPLHGPAPDVVENEIRNKKPLPGEILGSMLVRLPNFRFSRVSSVVSVPDGGTVLLGGIRRRDERLANNLLYRDFVVNRYDFFADDITIKGGIDRFVRNRLLSNATNAEFGGTDDEFIRRLRLDLVGIPPSPDEVDQYIRGLWSSGNAAAADFDSLIRLIETTVSPVTWDKVGGPGTIDAFEGNLSLVISQTQEVHRGAGAGIPVLTELPYVSRLFRNDFGAVEPTTVQLPRFARWGLTEISPDVWSELTNRRHKFRSVDMARLDPHTRIVNTANFNAFTNGSARIVKALNDSTSFDFTNERLQKVVEYIEDQHGIQVELDLRALEDHGVDQSTRVTKNFSDISLRSALRLLLADFDLDYIIKDGVLLITSENKLGDEFGRYEELLLPFHLQKSNQSQRVTIDAKAERASLEAWASRLTESLESGLKPPKMLYFQPAPGNDRRVFRNLVAFAPGMRTSRADILSVLEREAEIKHPAKRGEVDERARELILAARKQGWRSITIPREGRKPLRILVDGQGRFRVDRVTSHGLLEQIINDGETIWHLYPELGIGAKRSSSRFHRAKLLSLIPGHVRSLDDMATGADLRMVGERTIAIISHAITDKKSKDEPQPYSRVHLVFNESGSLAERKLIEMPTGKLIARTVYGEKVQLRDADGKVVEELDLKVANAAAPDLKPDTKDLVVLPMPVRDRNFILNSAKAADQTPSDDENPLQQISDDDRPSTDVARWSEEHALNFIAACHLQDHTELYDIIGRRFFAQGDRRIGFYTLLLSAGCHWNVDTAIEVEGDQKVDMNPLADHPDSPLAIYIASQLKLDGASKKRKKLPPTIRVEENEFISRLAEYRYLHARWSVEQSLSEDAEQHRRDITRMFDFIDQCDDPTFVFTLLRRVQHQLGGKQPYGRIADALLRFEEQGISSYVVQYELARQILANDEVPFGNFSEKAKKLFFKLYQDTFEQGILPPIDKAFLKALDVTKESDDPFDDDIPVDSADPFGAADDADEQKANASDINFEELMLETCGRLIEQRRRPTGVALAWQCRQLGQNKLAKQLIEKIQSGLPEDERILTSKAVMIYFLHSKQLARAESLVKSLLADKELAKFTSLWRLGSKIAADAEMLARSLYYREQAIELELNANESAVNLAWLRSEYAELLEGYERLAKVVANPESNSPDELVVSVVRAADQWRSLDVDATQSCRLAAKVLNRIGEEELAWDYLTTPLALKPNDAAPWLDLAKSMRLNDQFVLADQAFAAAFEAEPTNADILWQHAQMLDEHGHSQRALQLYSQIAGKEWQPRFRWIRNQAKKIIDRQ